MPSGRVLVALDDGPLVASPTWTRIDNISGCRCNGIDIRRGRQSEFDSTQTGEANVYFHDTNGDLDPDNSSSSYFGKLDGAQIMLQLLNPVTSTWVTQFRGFIDNITFDHDKSQIVSNVQIDCVDMFDFLVGVEMVIGTFGDSVPAGRSSGTVFYDNGRVDDRIIALLTDAGLSSSLWAVFTGNVDVCETQYNPGDAILTAIRDAADAEFPGVANCYIDKSGIFQFHGRLARFDPETVAASASGWDFNSWKAGDGAAIAADSTRAQIRPPFRYSRPRSRIINSAIAYPRTDEKGNKFDESDIPSLMSVDSTSIAAYGRRGWSATDLIVLQNFNNSNTSAEECKLYADYYVNNYKDPQNSIEAVTFKSLRPDDARASANWGLICGIDISDRLNLSLGYPGGTTGLSDIDYFVEGIQLSIRPGPPEYDIVELTPNLSPAAYYTDNVFS